MISRRSFLGSSLGVAGVLQLRSSTGAAAFAQSAPVMEAPLGAKINGPLKILYIGGGRLARQEAEAWTTVDAVSFEAGTPHLEYQFYEHLAVHKILKKAVQAEKDGFDAVVIGCFYDPGLREARELVNIPIVGVCEASLSVASMLSSSKFSVLVGRRKWISKMAATSQSYGYDSRIASWRVLDLTVPDMRDKVRTKEAVFRETKRAIEEDSAECIVLGCTGLAGQAKEVQAELKVPVLDPVLMGLKVAELRAILWKRYALSHSKIGGYEPPPADELRPIFDKTYGVS